MSKQYSLHVALSKVEPVKQPLWILEQIQTLRSKIRKIVFKLQYRKISQQFMPDLMIVKNFTDEVSNRKQPRKDDIGWC